MGMPISLSWPFRVDPYGAIASTSDARAIWQDRVVSVLGTQLGERVMRPTFGSRLGEVAFEGEQTAESIIEDAVTEAFLQFLPSLNLLDVSVMSDAEYSGQVSVVVEFALANDDELTVSLDLDLPTFEDYL